MRLENTKERALPQHDAQTLDDYLVYLKHVALYEFAKKFTAQKIVLDLGCGEGYGANELARSAQFVIAADYDWDVVAHARSKYGTERRAFIVCDAQRLPFRDAVFGATISFEVIEHLANVRAYLDEIKRVNTGAAIISTPNRLLRLLPFQKPWNRFHLREYDPRGFARALREIFARVDVRGVTARADILAIEKRRVKQNPFFAYPRMFAQILLPRAWYERVKAVNPSAPEPRVNFDAARAAYSANDFEISARALNESITLVAVCER